MLIEYWRFARNNPRFLGFGFFLAFISSAGQTYFIGVFGPGIQADFDLDPGSWGRLYMLGTLASALVINWSGSLIDRYDLRLFTAACLLGLTCACLFMGAVTSPLLLIGAIFLLRHFGQGLASHCGITSMARYHDADRGKAIALAAIGFSFGEASLPVVGIYLSQAWGWRQTYFFVAAAILSAIPLALWLLKGHDRRHAEFASAQQQQRDAGHDGSYTRRRVLTDFRFYCILPSIVAPSMIGTAFFFFPAEIAAAKGWSNLWLTGNYWLYSVVTVAMTIYSGSLIDRFSARQVVPFFLAPFALALICINLSDHRFVVWPYLLLMGMSMGVYFTGLSALWAELYGARHLGAIKSMTNAVMVFSSALGPAIMGSMLQRGFSFAAVCAVFLAFTLLAMGLLIYVLKSGAARNRAAG